MLYEKTPYTVHIVPCFFTIDNSILLFTFVSHNSFSKWIFIDISDMPKSFLDI